MVYTLYVMRSESKFFFHDNWIELIEFDRKKYVSNFKKIFYKSQNCGSILLIFENNGILNFCVKYFFKISNILFFIQFDELYPTITKKEKKTSSEILNCEHITYSANTLKIKCLISDSL
jgi:hypothetical protein